MPKALPQDLIDLLRKPSPCFVATLMPDGSPQLTQTWVTTDGEHVVINVVDGHQKAKNLARDARVAVNIVDPTNVFRYYAVRGRVIDMTNRGRPGEHRRDLAQVPRHPVPELHRAAGDPRTRHDRGRHDIAAARMTSAVRDPQ